ncbi:extradiol dioxygenase family protein [Hoeflea marina]|uniref:Extradiol dioxygenase family protein n=1 Tax=Hoeflea marina TaxID=274592 RepID=A0A317PFD6_9HYPH|nr:VOC family protein [Hoeflea marina]PWV98775.1 extradiol dioxygenase family protein [Hoeflea marina]
MTVRRIVANISVPEDGLEAARRFYGGVLEMDVAMDLGWIVTFHSDATTTPQLSVASQGGSGTPVPELSVEVDDLDAVRRRAVAAGYEVEYGPVTESWGVRRFFVRDPFGRLVNILCHI